MGQSYNFLVIVILLTGSIMVSSFTQTEAGQLLTYRNPDYDIELQYPKDNWTKVDVLLDSHEIVRFETIGKVGGLFNRSTGFVKVSAFTFPGETVKGIGESMTSHFKNDTQNYRLVNSNLTQISNQSAYQWILYDYSSDSSTKTLDTIFAHGADFYEVMYSADPGNFDKYLPEARRITESLKFIG